MHRFPEPKPTCRYHQKPLELATMPNGREYLKCPVKGCPCVAAVPEPPQEHSIYFDVKCGKWLQQEIDFGPGSRRSA